MMKSLFLCLFIAFLILPSNGLAGSSGEINSSSGVPDKDLRYQDFQVTEDGTISGYIVNASGRPRSGVRIDMWLTNMQETRIFWRKSLNIGDMAPQAKYMVKERYGSDPSDLVRTKFMFRIPSGANFRNN